MVFMVLEPFHYVSSFTSKIGSNFLQVKIQSRKSMLLCCLFYTPEPQARLLQMPLFGRTAEGRLS